MEDNIINHPAGTAIINGGNPIDDCPTDWAKAKEMELVANSRNGELRDKEDIDGPVWSFDCGFKLDFDGGLVKISSRFYPPKTHYGPSWDGSVDVMLTDPDEVLVSKKFKCGSFIDLVDQVEAFKDEIKDKIRKSLI